MTGAKRTLTIARLAQVAYGLVLLADGIWNARNRAAEQDTDA